MKSFDRSKCGLVPWPDIWYERDDDGTYGLPYCCKTSRYDCDNCPYRIKDTK